METAFQFFCQHANVGMDENLLMLTGDFIDLQPSLSVSGPAIIDGINVTVVRVFRPKEGELARVRPELIFGESLPV